MSEKSVTSKLALHTALASEATTQVPGCFSMQEQTDMLSFPFLYYVISQFISAF